MSEPNDFDLFIGMTLAKLYDRRPEQLDLAPANFGLTDFEDDLDRERRWERWALTLNWLRKEGYMRCQSQTDGTEGEPIFLACELTEKGYRALNALPTALTKKGDNTPLGRQLVEATKKALGKSMTGSLQRGTDAAIDQVISIVRTLFS